MEGTGPLQGLHLYRTKWKIIKEKTTYTSPYFIRAIKSMRMRWAWQGEMRNRYSTLVENREGRNHLENLDVDGRIISEWVLGKYGGKMWTGFIWLRIGTSSGPF
jgi:hypothetical protein